MNTDLEPYQGGTPEPYERPQVPTISRDIIAPRLPEVGRIRLGERLPTKDGKHKYPAKIDAFRFTSRSRKPLEMVAELWGGTVVPWASDEGAQWQVYTTATSIECIVPKAELAFSQHFEDWEGATCNRRCDGHWEMQGDRACVCDPADRQCKPTTRLSVLLPDVPGMGVWRVESHGYNAAAEILGTIELAAMHGATLLPCTLTLENRSRRRYNAKSGKVETNRFVVPVLAISASLRQMVAEQAALRQRTLGLLPMAEPATPDRMRALRTAVFSRWPESVDEPERSIRLRQLSALLGRPVTTISNEHDLTAQEAIFLANAVDELPDEESTPALTREQSAPAADGAPGEMGADFTAPRVVIPRFSGMWPATKATWDAEQRSAGEGESQPDVVCRTDDPAEHRTDEAKGSAPADGTVPAGESRSDTGPSVGPAPAKSAPTRKRHKTDPGKGLSIPDAIAEKQRFMDERKAQTVVEHPPADPIQSMPPTFRELYLKHFGNELEPALGTVNAHIEAWGPRYPATGDAAPWSLELLQELAADTFEKDMY